MEKQYDLDLLDLISERHMQLRSELEDKWNHTSEMKISNSEWYVMAKLKDDAKSMAEITKSIRISRQATHKLLKNMAQKNLIMITGVPNNKKEKMIKLTDDAIHFFNQYETLKAEMMKAIEQAIGEQQYEQLLQLLQLQWR